MQLHLDPFCFFFQLGEMQCDRFGDGWDGSIGRELAWADQVSECVWNRMFVWGSQNSGGNFLCRVYVLYKDS